MPERNRANRPKAAEIDRIDSEILTILRANARASVTDIARRVDRSRATVYERIARLERSGVIAGYTLREGQKPADAGQAKAYMLLTLKTRAGDDVAAMLARIPHVKRCDILAGGVDMIVYLEAPSLADINTLRQRVAAFAGVTSVTTMPVLAEAVNR